MPKIMKSCLNLSKLRPKYCRSFFSGHGVNVLIGCEAVAIIVLIQCLGKFACDPLFSLFLFLFFYE